MSAGAFGRDPLGSEMGIDLIADGLLDLAEDLRGYAASAPAAPAGLSERVLAALREELRQGAPIVAPVASVAFVSRLTLGLRPASFRSLLVAAALVGLLGAGVAFAAAGGLPFQLPHLGSPERAAPVQPDTERPVAPDDEDIQGPSDEDDDSSPRSSDDADGDEDQDEDEDQDVDEDSNDEDEDLDDDSDEDGDEDDGDDDQDSDEDDEDDEEGAEDDDEGSDEDGPDEDDDEDPDEDGPDEDSDEDESGSAGNAEDD